MRRKTCEISKRCLSLNTFIHQAPFKSGTGNVDVRSDCPFQNQCCRDVVNVRLRRWSASDKVRVLKGVVVRRAVGEAGESARRLAHAAGDVERVGAERGRHGEVGELWVEVSQVCGARH